MEFEIFFKVELDSSKHKRTGNTKHFVGDSLIESLPAYLQIENNPEVENEVYLIHYDDNGNEMADTLHDSIEDAMGQADWEFGVKNSEWIKI